MLKKILMATICIGAVLLLACKPPETEEEVVVQDKPVPVRIKEVKARDLPVIVKSTGRLEPNREVVLSAEVSGIVDNYTADVGDEVAENQVVVMLESADYVLALNEARANLEAARARLAAAEKTFNRFKSLLPREVISQEAYDKAEADYKSAKAAVSQMEAMVSISRRRLKKCSIKSPFDSFVSARLVELGKNVGIGDPLMGIFDLKRMWVKIHLNERDYVHLDRDDPVEVKIEVFPDISFKGHVERVGIKADPGTNTFDVEIMVENPDIILKAGLTARVNITTEVIDAAIMIPQSCILFRETKKEVFIIDNDQKAVPREVTLGHVKGSLVRILDGLAPGDRLVVTGGQYLKPGTRVVISE
jgi:RND family efflux transporter MFP subunit